MSEFSPRRSGYARMFDRAMRILAVRDHGEQELRRKLAVLLGEGSDERAATPEELERVIAQCIEHRWIDDARFAQRYLAGRSRKGYGPQRIRQELQQKGVSRENVDAALATSDADWEALARAFALKKFGDPLPSDFAQKAKVQRFLLYRGFYMEDIQSIYRNFNV